MFLVIDDSSQTGRGLRHRWSLRSRSFRFRGRTRLQRCGSGVRLVLALALLLTSAPVSAQDWHTYFTVQNAEKFATDWRSFYERADAWTKATRATLRHHLDLPYGADPKQRLDVYVPAGAEGRAPVFLFIHGGGFREGDRAQYGYVARPLAAEGILTVVASYRLLPHVYPDQVEDAELMVAWIHREIARLGGDPSRIFVGGHSAGAILSALLGVTTDWQAKRGVPVDVVKGIVPVSGPYDLRQASGFVADFLPDASRREGASPQLRIVRAPPAVVAYGAKETPYIEASRGFVHALTGKGGRATLIELADMTHDRTALAMGDADSAVVRAAVSLIRGR